METGVHARAIEEIPAELGLQSAEDLVIADLTLGSWRRDQCAHEIAGQLGCELAPAPVAAAPRYELSYAEAASRAIDAESGGQSRAAFSAAAASAIAARAKAVVVMVPDAASEVPSQEAGFFSMLELAGVRVAKCVTPLMGEERVTQGRVVRLVPGAIDPRLLPLLPCDRGWLVPLRNGWHGVPPAFRRAAAATDSLEFDALAAVAEPVPWLAAYARAHCNSLFVEPDDLCRQAWRSFASGDDTTALRLLDRASAFARGSVEHAAIAAQAQGVRIATRRYQEAAEGPIPAEQAPAELRSFLLCARGWGLTMSGGRVQAAEARPLLEAARALAGGRGLDREQLYVANMLALSALKEGDAALALKIEREVQAGLARLEPRDWQLTYVNAMNLARLHRRAGDLELARDYYVRAFETADALRSPSDIVHANVCLARVDGEAGRVHEALLGWSRAALHLLAMPYPNALPQRPRLAIEAAASAAGVPVLSGVQDTLGRLIEDTVRRHPDQSLRHAVDAAPTETAPTFSSCGAATLAAGTDGVGLLAGPGPGAGRGGVRALVRQLLIALGCEGLTRMNAMVVDDRLGRGTPCSRPELVESAAWHGVREIRYGSEHHTIDPDAAEQRATVSVSPAVETMAIGDQGGIVVFRRYRSPALLTPTEAAIVRMLRQPMSQAGVALELEGALTTPEVAKCIRQLRSRRIVMAEQPNDGCAAGI